MDKAYIEKYINRTFIDFMPGQEFMKYPVVFTQGKGVYLWDTEGKRYFDAIGGIFVASLGHRHPRVMAAMKEQMDRLTMVPPLHSISDVTLKFIETLGKVTPGNLNYIKSFSGGSESIEAAIKFTRQYFRQNGQPDKMKVLSNYLSYHGATFGAMSASGSPRKIKFEPQMPGFVKVYSPKQLRDDFGTWDETCRYAAKLVRRTIEAERPETVGVFLVEPICNTAGIITPTEEYFHMLRDTCDEYGVILIFDEVLTGFGKTGDMFAAQTFGVTPDIICSGKGLSTGLIPVGAMIAREDLAQGFNAGTEANGQNFMHGHTFANFPLADAVATAVINVMTEEKLPERARALGKYISGRLEGLKKYGVIREVRGKGILLGVELVEDPVTNRPFPEGRKLGTALKRTALDNGIILRIDADWFAIAPPLVTTDEEAAEMCDRIESSLKQALDMVSKSRGGLHA
jgi:adenosylmethionine-8-amino-7-oxononanoate aminotransferase